MKHVVELKYTNPSHEHVSLRRRVETINRVVEAQNADEALNRAANQQRALGFRVQSANIVEQKVEEPNAEMISEAKGTAGYPLLKKGEKLKPMKLGEEDVELEEANMRFDYEAAARPKSSDVKNFLNRDKNARAAAASKKYIRRMTKLGGLSPNQTKKDTEAHMKAHFEEVEIDEAKKPLKPSYWKAEWRLGTQTEVDKNNKKIYDRLAKTDPNKAKAFHDNLMKIRKEEIELSEASKEAKSVMLGMRSSLKAMDLRHGVDSDKREAGYKMSPAVKAAQAKSDALSKVKKPVQAGTLAAAKMKKEAVEPGSMKVVNKKVKAAEKMINAAKGKVNKIDLKPTLDLEKHKD